MIAFKDYIEDYNTATMPHDKYYNLEAWEMKEYRRVQTEKANKSGIITLLYLTSLCIVMLCYVMFHIRLGSYFTRRLRLINDQPPHNLSEFKG